MIVAVLVSLTLAQEAVDVRIEPMTFNVAVAETARRGSKEPNTGYYPIRETIRVVERTVEVVKLDNGLVEAWVVPAWGARLLRAIDKKTGVDYFRWGDTVEGHLPWSKPGGVKPSFPFFEHGTHLEQPAGYRIVRGTDGSVTVAMDLRFTQHTTPADAQRYGRFGDESLNVMVSVRPGSSVVEWRQRKDNPNPLPRAERMWNDVLYPVDRPTTKQLVRNKKSGLDEEKDVEDRVEMSKRTRFIYPVRYVTDHGPRVVHSSPHWTNKDNWDVSHFAIDAPYHFVGVYDVVGRINRLRINDEHGPAAKLYTNYRTDFCEHWGSVGYVFEKPGALRSAHEPVEFTHWFWTAQGIGEASFANREIAVSVDGKTFEMVASHQRTVSVSDGSGKTVAEGVVGPHTVLSGNFDGARLVVIADDRPLLEQVFPLDRPTPAPNEVIPEAVRRRFEEIVASGGPEGETVAKNEGTIAALDGIATNPRVAYRFGQFDQALRLIEGKNDPGSDLLRGLIAWERGEPVDFGSAGWEADYLRALLAIRGNDKPRAIELASRYIEHVPRAWYPRLARAYWSADKTAARSLAEENPGSPEAQLVLKLLGEPHELDALLKNNPHADLHVALFEAQVVRGEWKHLPRYPVGPTSR